MPSREDKLIRIPADVVERANALVPALSTTNIGSAVRWTETALIRLLVIKGLESLERELEAPAETTPR